MVYLNLHRTDGTVTGENVDPVAALDNNYDIIDNGITAMQGFQGGATVNLANADTGQEVTPADASSPAYCALWVADNTGTWHDADTTETWGAWTSITLNPSASPAVTTGAGRPPQFRKSNYGRLELRGCIAPTAGNFTLNVWKLWYDGSTNSDAIHLIANRPNTPISIGATAKYFKVVGTAISAGSAGQENSCVVCVTNDPTFTYMQMYYMFTDTSTTPSGQNFCLDGMIWDMQGAPYAGTT